MFFYEALNKDCVYIIHIGLLVRYLRNEYDSQSDGGREKNDCGYEQKENIRSITECETDSKPRDGKDENVVHTDTNQLAIVDCSNGHLTEKLLPHG